jgi:hypothetical protein
MICAGDHLNAASGFNEAQDARNEIMYKIRHFYGIMYKIRLFYGNLRLIRHGMQGYIRSASVLMTAG